MYVFVYIINWINKILAFKSIYYYFLTGNYLQQPQQQPWQMQQNHSAKAVPAMPPLPPGEPDYPSGDSVWFIFVCFPAWLMTWSLVLQNLIIFVWNLVKSYALCCFTVLSIAIKKLCCCFCCCKFLFSKLKNWFFYLNS